MSKSFRPWDVDQGWLLPPSLHEFVPPGHLAHFVRDLVRETLDLTEILSGYNEVRGYPPYHPAMMVALLLYGYSRGRLFLAPLGPSLRGAGGLHGGHPPEPAGLPHGQRLPQASPRRPVRPVCAGAAAVPGGGAGTVRIDGDIEMVAMLVFITDQLAGFGPRQK
jgi:hypothetical protein